MAEILGAIASITQLLQMSANILTTGYGFLSKVIHAPEEIRQLLSETAAVNSLLGQLQELTDSSSGKKSSALLQQLGVLKDCQDILRKVKAALDTCKMVQGQDRSNLRHRLIWPFKERETKQAIEQLARLRAILLSAVTVDSA